MELKRHYKSERKPHNRLPFSSKTMVKISVVPVEKDSPMRRRTINNRLVEFRWRVCEGNMDVAFTQYYGDALYVSEKIQELHDKGLIRDC